MKIQVKKLNDLAILPAKGSSHCAGYDLSSIEDYILMPMERKLFKTGLSISIPNGLYGRIAPRSGLAFKDGIDVLAGVIDEDYRGEIGILLINFGRTEKQIKSGDKIAQIIFEFYNNVNVQLVSELNETGRGDSGFGSSDNKTKNLSTVEYKPTSPLISLFQESAANIPHHSIVTYEAAIKEREKQI